MRGHLKNFGVCRESNGINGEKIDLCLITEKNFFAFDKV